MSEMLFLDMGKSLKLDSAHLKQEIKTILDEDGLSPEDLAKLAKVSKTTIYAILDLDRESTQRAIGKKIAEGTGRAFKIEGEKIFFFRRQAETVSNEDPKLTEIFETIKLRPDMQEIYDLLMRMPEKKRESILEFLKGMVDDLD